MRTKEIKLEKLLEKEEKFKIILNKYYQQYLRFKNETI